MKFFLDSHALKRLVDPDLNVRQRSLNELNSILRNNILFEASAINQQNEISKQELQVVNLDVLTRQLIRWFQIKPVTNCEEILDLLILILGRRDFLKYITQTISIPRLKKEMFKIAKMLIPEPAALKLSTIEQILVDFESYDVSIRSQTDTGSFQRIESPVHNNEDSQESDFINRMNNLQLVSPVSSINATECDDKTDVFNDLWIKLKGKDLQVFNQLDEELLVYNNQESFKKALAFLLASIEDFPPEYFLQPPNMLETLMDILWKVTGQSRVNIVRIIRFILNGLRDRWNEAKNNDTCFISTKKHLNKIIQIFTSFFERFHDEFDQENISLQDIEILNDIYLLLFDMAHFIRESNEACEIYLNELMNMMAKVVKDFRIASLKDGPIKFTSRVNYLASLYLINVFLTSFDTYNISQFCKNNVWEYECDIALLDFTLKISHEDIYKIIMKNRIDVIKEDKDLELLLNIEKLWKPVVEIYQNHESLSDVEIINYAKEAIDVIRIIKNPKFVDVVFKAIVNSSYQFNVQLKLKETSEEMFLRLISNENSEIKLRAYSLARESVQKRMSEDCNNSNLKDADLCVVVGMPLNAEIITEIICFGLMDSDTEIYEHAKMILFALLRGKVVFPAHWEAILEVINPALALMPCLFSKEPKLGFFALDIFNRQSFTKDELNRAYAAFLFCSHPNARDMAKRKLLENYEEYSSEFIEIVPDNFCILRSDQITDILIPDRAIGYDREAYATTVVLIKNSSTHNDPEILSSILLQLSVLMNSAKLCEKSHNDDNLWMYFMPALDMNFPNNTTIRKLTINILYKWAVTISLFRIYLAKEPKVLQFIINTLINYQDDDQIKKQASALLFLILFTDFVVVTDRTTSLPKILSTLECPFKFSKHWEESPFNKISQIEWLHDSMERDTNQDSDIKDVTRRYFRFTFANEWFHSDLKTVSTYSQDFYYDKFKNSLKLPEKIVLTDSEYKLLEESGSDYIEESFIKSISNVVTADDISRLVQQVITGLMLPNINIEEFAHCVDRNLRGGYDIFNPSGEDNNCKDVFIKLLKLYQHLVPSLSDERLYGLFREKPIQSFINSPKNIEEPDVYIQILQFINSIIKTCATRYELADTIRRYYKSDFKSDFSSRFVEKLFSNVFDNYVKTRMLNDVRALPFIKMIFTTIKNILIYFPITLDEPYINATFQEMISGTKIFLSQQKSLLVPDNSLNMIRHTSTHVVYLMHEIIERLCSLSFRINLNSENYTLIFLWLTDQERRDNALMWKIVAQLTKQNLHFVEFCKGFMESVGTSFYDVVTEIIRNAEKTSRHERKAQALVVGNFLDFLCESNLRDLGLKNNRKTPLELKQDLAVLFIEQKNNNNDAICHLIKKMIHNNMINAHDKYSVSQIVKQKKIVEYSLQNGIANLDTVVACYRYHDLQSHVVDKVLLMKDDALFKLLSRTKTSSLYFKSMNKNIFSIILILLQSEDGYEKANKAIFKSQKIFNNFVLILSNGLHCENSFGEIMYHLEFISSLFNYENVFSTCQVSSLLCGGTLLRVLKKYVKNRRLENFVINNLKLVQYTIELFILLIIALFDNFDLLKFNDENKCDMRAQIFLIVKKIMDSSEQARLFATKIDLPGILQKRLMLMILAIENRTRIEMNKKKGVNKCTLITKEIYIYIKALTEWNLSVQEMEPLLVNVIEKFESIFNWINSDLILLNAFVSFLRRYNILQVGNVCTVKKGNGMPIMAVIFKKAQEMSSKMPITDSNSVLLKNILEMFVSFSTMTNVRGLLKYYKIFAMLEILHPQLQKNRKTAWNDVTVMWLKLFERLSLYEDTDCNPNQISILCRLIRINDFQIAKISLKIIRNITMKSKHGYAVLNSVDFMETVSTILNNEWKSETEKLFILQTLLSLASKGEQMRSKLKNSSFNRQLKDYMATLQLDENLQIYNLTTMLSDVLYPQ